MWNNEANFGRMTDWAGDGWQWFMGFHGFWILLFLAVLIFAAVALIRDYRRDDFEKTTIDRLADRYASGDIDRDEYLRTKRDMSDGKPVT
ncbi:MAG: hypothetical protein HQ503_14535 [Rhodospirillales bacterium]|nr:hypothetical protein [Rhodospirillales bacterium]